jgi:hypothetical protein
VAAADLKNMKMPPLVALRRHGIPRRIQMIVRRSSSISVPGTGFCTDTQRLALYVTASGGINPVSCPSTMPSIPTTITLRCGRLTAHLTGRSKMLADSIPVTSVPYGKHLFHVRAQTRSSVAAIDTFSFYVMQGKLYPVALIDNFQDSDFVPGPAGFDAVDRIGANEQPTGPLSRLHNQGEERHGDYYYNGDFTVMQPAGLNYDQLRAESTPTPIRITSS